MYFRKYNIAKKWTNAIHGYVQCNALYMIIYVHNLFAVLLLIKKTKQKGSKWFW
jgi:hypothetical protein